MDRRPTEDTRRACEDEASLRTDELVAQAHANRQGKAYPTPERLLETLPAVLRALCDYTLSGQATAQAMARVLASMIDAVENTQDVGRGVGQKRH